MTAQQISDNTPIAMLTVAQLKIALGIDDLFRELRKPKIEIATDKKQPKTTQIGGKTYVYKLSGLAYYLDCSIDKVVRYRRSRILDKATLRNGRNVMFDIELALELVTNKGGRKL